MKIQFHFKQVDVSEALKEYTESQFESLGPYLLKESLWHVFYSLGKFDACVEVVVTNSEGTFKAKANSEESLYAAVDEAAEKLGRQFLRFKDKMQDHSKIDRSRRGKLSRLNAKLEFDGTPFRSKRTG